MLWEGNCDGPYNPDFPFVEAWNIFRDLMMTEKTKVNLKYELEDYENNKKKGPTMDMKGMK